MKKHSLDHLKQRVSVLLAVYEQHALFIPAPDLAKGKVWSSRNYGQDKKKLRKNTERAFLVESRIPQLEEGLRSRGLMLSPPPHRSAGASCGGGSSGQDDDANFPHEEDEDKDEDKEEEDAFSGEEWHETVISSMLLR